MGRVPRTAGLLCATLMLAASSVVVGVVPAAARSSGSTNCRSGQTLFRKHGIRAFLVGRLDRSTPGDPLPYQVIYACSPALRKPRLLFTGDIGTATTAEDFAVFGPRLGFLAPEAGGVVLSTYFGWFNVRTGAVRSVLIDGGTSDPQFPSFPSDSVSYAIAGDGAVALMGDESVVAVLLPRGRSLSAPRRLVADQNPDLDPASIAITATTVSWRTKAGVATTVPR